MSLLAQQQDSTMLSVRRTPVKKISQTNVRSPSKLAVEGELVPGSHFADFEREDEFTCMDFSVIVLRGMFQLCRPFTSSMTRIESAIDMVK